jgi:hypothetical protein
LGVNRHYKLLILSRFFPVVGSGSKNVTCS